jgi:hypothetical protein
MANKKTSADWRDRPLEKWNVATFHYYLSDKHLDLYGINYVPFRGWMAEKGMLKREIDEHGPEIVKQFIDACFADYRPTAQYPSINFGFMNTWMKSRILPPILADEQRKQRLSECANERMSVKEINDYL